MICDVCQQPMGDVEGPPRTAAGEPAHAECLLEHKRDVAAGAIENARETLLDDDRLGEASDEYEAGWVDALIAMDLLLTDPTAFYDDDD